jgi:hypothetical protein
VNTFASTSIHKNIPKNSSPQNATFSGEMVKTFWLGNERYSSSLQFQFKLAKLSKQFTVSWQLKVIIYVAFLSHFIFRDP